MQMLDVSQYSTSVLNLNDATEIYGGMVDPVVDAGKACGSFCGKFVKGLGAVLGITALFFS